MSDLGELAGSLIEGMREKYGVEVCFEGGYRGGFDRGMVEKYTTPQQSFGTEVEISLALINQGDHRDYFFVWEKEGGTQYQQIAEVGKSAFGDYQEELLDAMVLHLKKFYLDICDSSGEEESPEVKLRVSLPCKLEAEDNKGTKEYVGQEQIDLLETHMNRYGHFGEDLGLLGPIVISNDSGETAASLRSLSEEFETSA